MKNNKFYNVLTKFKIIQKFKFQNIKIFFILFELCYTSKSLEKTDSSG